MMSFRIICIFILWAITFSVSGQAKYRLVSYNVENLYDVTDEPGVNDNDFTPAGKNRWTHARYTDKLLKISRTLVAVGEGELPAFIGLSEIENRRVLEDLISKSVLSEGDYEIIHRNSPDMRGIDVAFLYRTEFFTPLQQQFIPISFPEDKRIRTRDILYTSGILATRDTLHFFVCHFPSMSGGELASEWKRERAASTLKHYIDSIQLWNKKANIIILGDLNGKADRTAQKVVLGVKSSDDRKIKNENLYNTGYYLLNKNEGSYKYQGDWQTIDHIIVSGVLLDSKNRIYTDKRLKLFQEDFLLEEDKKYFGFKPYRTYSGPRYHGGYSDHLPIYLDIYSK
ncbi:endonuclease [Odoribacter sp. OttesenSCG-928-G04]|nr:endonuclease [Odoribacter sp. OttesenSCG-928-G04]